LEHIKLDKTKANTIQTDKTKVAVYGGNGFVGTRVAKALLEQDVCAICLSRTGHKPLHLKDCKWSESVRWCKGDASTPDTQLLEHLDGLVTLVGSQEAYDQQVFMNGTANANAIREAGKSGIKRIVLVGAQIPFFIRGDHFGYASGKSVPLDIFLKPLSWIMPWQFVSVEKLAERIACEMLCDDQNKGQLIVIKNSQI